MTVVITKVGGPGGRKRGLTARYIAEGCEASLKRLGIETIDLYLSHLPDADTPYEETLGAFAKLKQAGKIRWFGASNLDAAQLQASLGGGAIGGPAALRGAAAGIQSLRPRQLRRPAARSLHGARTSASSPISASPRAFSPANIAARRISAKARAAAASRPISTRAGCASWPRSTRSPSARRAKPAEVALAWLIAAARRHRADRQRDLARAARKPDRGDEAGAVRAGRRRARRRQRGLTAPRPPLSGGAWHVLGTKHEQCRREITAQARNPGRRRQIRRLLRVERRQGPQLARRQGHRLDQRAPASATPIRRTVAASRC